jgi:hypothetical protein
LEVEMKNNMRWASIEVKNNNELLRKSIENPALEKRVVESHQYFWGKN